MVPKQTLSKKHKGVLLTASKEGSVDDRTAPSTHMLLKLRDAGYLKPKKVERYDSKQKKYLRGLGITEFGKRTVYIITAKGKKALK